MPLHDGTNIYLIFEPEDNGHQREWLSYLIEFAIHDTRRFNAWFLMSPHLCSVFAAEFSERLASKGQGTAARIRFLPLGPREHRLCCHRTLAISGFARWWTMRRYIGATGAKAGHFLSFDHVTLPFGLLLGMKGRKVCGVLFRPSVHYAELSHYQRTAAEFVRDTRKAILYRIMLLNPAVRHLLTLDPYFPEYARRRYEHGDKIDVVPDPAHPANDMSKAATGVAAELPKDRVNFVLYGSLTERKGVLVLMEALHHLPPAIAERTGIVIAGKLDPGIRARVLEAARLLVSEQPGLWLWLEDRWLESNEVASLAAAANIILAPYQRFVGSSGLMQWAARAGKPILTQDNGLVGRLVTTHKLGLAVDSTDPRILARAIALMVTHGPNAYIDREATENYIKEQTPERFCSEIFESLLAS